LPILPVIFEPYSSLVDKFDHGLSRLTRVRRSALARRSGSWTYSIQDWRHSSAE